MKRIMPIWLLYVSSFLDRQVGQVGIAIGIQLAGLIGGLMAWIGFTLPSAIALMIFAWVLKGLNIQQAGWVHGLMIVAIAVVAQAFWGMASKLATVRMRGAIAILSAVVALLVPTSMVQVFIIIVSGLIGWRFFKKIITGNPTDANADQSENRYCFSFA